jgi:excisionase family DNA binding protein
MRVSDEGLWTVKETAAYLKLKPRTVSDMAKDGRLSARRVAGEWRFDPSDARLYDERQQPTSEAPSARNGATGGTVHTVAGEVPQPGVKAPA